MHLFLLLLFFPGRAPQASLQAPAYCPSQSSCQGCGRLLAAQLLARLQRRQEPPPPPAPAPPPGAEPGLPGAESYRPQAPVTARRPRGAEGREGPRTAPAQGAAASGDGSAVQQGCAPLKLRRRPARPPARGLPLPGREAASGLSPLLRRSPRTCPRRGGAESRRPRPCGGGERADLPPPSGSAALAGGDLPLSLRLDGEEVGGHLC